MTAIGWLLIMLAVAAIIDGYHGKGFWSSLGQYLAKGNGATAK